MNWRDYLVLLWGVIAICIAVFLLTLFLVGPGRAEEGDMPCAAYCTAFVLKLDGQEIYNGPRDMTAAECGEFWDEIEYQTPPFTKLVCEEVFVERQDL